MKRCQLNAISRYYANKRRENFLKFIEENKIDLKTLGLDKYKYIGVKCRKLRELGYKIEL